MDGNIVTSHQSYGKISSHNAHTLDDDIDSIDGNRPKTSGTHSSEESQLIDRSDSEGSIDTEKNYQEDLKERVKRSFAELGLNPSNETNESLKDSLEDDNDRNQIADNEIMRDSLEYFVVAESPFQNAKPKIIEESDNKQSSQLCQYDNNNNNSEGNEDPSSSPPNHSPSGDDIERTTNYEQNNKISKHTNILGCSGESTLSAETILPENTSQELITMLPGGEKVRVEYISDDSGDDDEHYVDEKGSPIHFDIANENKKHVYEIKPKPPGTPINSAKQAMRLRRYSFERQAQLKQEHSGANVAIKQTDVDTMHSSQIESEKPVLAAHRMGTGNFDSSIPQSINHGNNTKDSVSSEKHTVGGSKIVDADVYAKIQLKSQKKIKSKELLADKRIKKVNAKQQQSICRHHSPNKTTKEKLPGNKSATLRLEENNHNHETRGHHEPDRNSVERKHHAASPAAILNNECERTIENQDILHQNHEKYRSREFDEERQQQQIFSENATGQIELSSEVPDVHLQTIYQQQIQGNFYGSSQPTFPVHPAYAAYPQEHFQHQQQHQYYQNQILPAPHQVQYSQGNASYRLNNAIYHPSQPHVQTQPVHFQNPSNQLLQNQFIPSNLNFQMNYSPSYRGNNMNRQTNQSQHRAELEYFNSTHNGLAPNEFLYQDHPQSHVQSAQFNYLPQQQPINDRCQPFEGQKLTEEIPPLDLSGIVDDYPETHGKTISPVNQHVSNNSNRKATVEKPKMNFIEHNKIKLKKENPQMGYLDRYKQDINPKRPLPSISRGNSEDKDDLQWPNVDNDYAQQQTWMEDPNVDSRNLSQLIRQQSDSAVQYSNTDLRNIISPEQGRDRYQQTFNNYSQSAPVHLPMRSHNPKDQNRESSPSWPQFNTGGSRINFSSFSADHATSYARMQYKSKVVSDVNSPRSSFQRPEPYPVLPNIQDAQTDEPDGYLAKMQKTKKEPQYKMYTLKDYQKLKVDTKLGGLGPDTEAALEKQEKALRQREYAKEVMLKNRKNYQQPKAQSWSPPHESALPKTPTKRELAIEYSKRVPKPRIPTPPEKKHEMIYGNSSENEMKKLEELRLRHEKEKQEVAKIKHEIRT